MRRIARAESLQPAVRDLAARLVGNCAPLSSVCRASRLFEWVRARMRYVPDPTGTEAIGTPTYHLRNVAAHGSTSGDCDDAAVLLAALARAVGLRARFAVASFLPSRRLHHIYAELHAGGRWWDCDTFRSEQWAAAPSRVVRVEL